MTKRCISEAIAILEELHSSLDNAYWEASSIAGKDRFYNLISAINKELSELSKLSVQDHNLSYEMISSEFSSAAIELRNFQRDPEKHILRSSTALRLNDTLQDLTSLLSGAKPTAAL